MRSNASFLVSLLSFVSAFGYTPAGSGQTVSEPKWPQSFVAVTGKPAGFGFVVTQPGPISVSVQSAAPVLVTLFGPLPKPIQQGGTGNVELAYVATAADVQRSYLWTVQIGSNAPQPVHGVVSVSQPPADMNLANRQIQLIRQRYTQYAASNAAAQAAANQAIAAQQQAQQQLAASQAIKAQQLLGSMGGAPAAPTSPAPAVTTRALPTTTPAPTTTTAIRPGALPMSQPPPAIAALSVGEGQPGDPVLITGSSFGSTGQVHFVVNPGMDLTAPVDRWTSTQILAHVPPAQGIQRYVGSLYVTVPPVVLTVAPRNLTSPAQQFIFDPQIDTQVLLAPSNFTDANISQPNYYGCTGVTYCDPGGCPPFGFVTYPIPMCSAGHGFDTAPQTDLSGDDQWYLTTNLKNGWTFAGENLLVNGGGSGGCGTANIVPTKRPLASSSLFTAVHWLQPATCLYFYYGLTITIKGPLGTSPF